VHLQVGAHAVAIVSLSLREGFSRNGAASRDQPSPFSESLEATVLSVGTLIARHRHERGALTGNELVAAHAVIS